MDDEWIAGAQAGDREAFRRLVDRYGGPAERTARALLADPATAEDAVQEAWLDAWRALPRFERGRPFRPWLLTLVANRCRMAARRRTLPRGPYDQALALAADPAADPGVRAAGGDPALAAALAGLAPEQRQLLALRYYADLELDDIARLTGAPLGTVKSRLHRALQALRSRLAPAPDAGLCSARKGMIR